jgi:hypothetical protein
MSFQRIFQLLSARGAAVETQHTDRRHHPQKKFVPFWCARDTAALRRLSRFSNDSRLRHRGLSDPAEVSFHDDSELFPRGPLA